MEGDFKVAYVQSLILMFEIEKTPDVAVAILELVSYLCKDVSIEPESRYEII